MCVGGGVRYVFRYVCSSFVICYRYLCTSFVSSVLKYVLLSLVSYLYMHGCVR